MYPPKKPPKGEAKIDHEGATPYKDAGVRATDTHDGDISSTVNVTTFLLAPLRPNDPYARAKQQIPALDVMLPAGTSFSLSYSAVDSTGNMGNVVSRGVDIVDTTPPILTLEGSETMVWECGASYVDPGYVSPVLNQIAFAHFLMLG